jgi:hypothetical protein
MPCSEVHVSNSLHSTSCDILVSMDQSGSMWNKRIVWGYANIISCAMIYEAITFYYTTMTRCQKNTSSVVILPSEKSSPSIVRALIILLLVLLLCPTRAWWLCWPSGCSRCRLFPSLRLLGPNSLRVLSSLAL